MDSSLQMVVVEVFQAGGLDLLRDKAVFCAYMRDVAAGSFDREIRILEQSINQGVLSELWSDGHPTPQTVANSRTRMEFFLKEDLIADDAARMIAGALGDAVCKYCGLRIPGASQGAAARTAQRQTQVKPHERVETQRQTQVKTPEHVESQRRKDESARLIERLQRADRQAVARAAVALGLNLDPLRMDLSRLSVAELQKLDKALERPAKNPGESARVNRATDMRVVRLYGGVNVAGGTRLIIANETFEDSRNQVETLIIEDGVAEVQVRGTVLLPALKQIVISRTVRSLGDIWRLYGPVERFEVQHGSATYTSAGGVVYSVDGQQLAAYPHARQEKSFELPPQVVKIGDYAFFSAVRLEKVTLNSALQSIGVNAFKCCEALQRVDFNAELRTIGVAAFQRCKNLRQVSLCDRTNWIGSGAFAECEKLEEVRLPTTGNLKVGQWAFYRCGPNLKFNGGNTQKLKVYNADGRLRAAMHQCMYCGGGINLGKCGNCGRLNGSVADYEGKQAYAYAQGLGQKE